MNKILAKNGVSGYLFEYRVAERYNLHDCKVNCLRQYILFQAHHCTLGANCKLSTYVLKWKIYTQEDKI